MRREQLRKERLLMNKKRIFGFAAAVIILLAVLLLEVFVYNADGRAYDNYKETYALDGSDDRVSIELQEFTSELDEKTAEELRYQEEMNRLYYELLGAEYESTLEETLTVIDGKTYKTVQQAVIRMRLDEPRFVRQLQFSYPVDESKYASYGVEARFYLNGKELNESQLYYDTVNSRLDTGFMNVKLYVDEIELETYGDFGFDGTGVTASICNEFQFNWFRVVFLAGSGWLLLFLFLAGELYIKRLEVMFAVMSIWFGGCMVVLIGCNQLGWDEHIHFLKAYEASFSSTIETPEAAMGMRGKYTPESTSLTEREAVTEYLRANDDMEKADISYRTRFKGYAERAYLPQAMFLKTARMLNMPFDWQYMMGKLGNLLFYTLVLAVAIRIAKTGKKFIAVIGLMPTPLFLASEYSYDAFILGFLILGFVLWLNELFSKEPMTWYSALMMMGCFVAGSWSKQIYIFMIFLLCFLPARKFKNKTSMLLFKLMPVLIAAMILYSIFGAPGAAKGLNISVGLDYDFSTAGDVRVQGVSMMGQIQYILQNPLTYTVLLLKSLVSTAWNYTFGRAPWLDLAYCGILPASFSLATALLVAGTVLIRTREESTLTVKPVYKGLLAVMIFGIACVIWTSLYGTYSVVGSATIDGVQARYYLPLMLPFFCLFGNNRIKFKWSSEWYYRILFMAIAVLNIIGIYQNILMKTMI